MGNFEILCLVVIILTFMVFIIINTILVSTYLLNLAGKKASPLEYANTSSIKNGESEVETSSSIKIGDSDNRPPDKIVEN